MDGDGALIHSSASLPVKPLLTLDVGKANVVRSVATNRARCDREPLFHFKAILISGGADGLTVVRSGGVSSFVWG